MVKADQLSSVNADSRRIKLRPPALLRAAAMFGPALKNVHVFGDASRGLLTSTLPAKDTKVWVNVKSMSLGPRQLKLPLKLRVKGRTRVSFWLQLKAVWEDHAHYAGLCKLSILVEHDMSKALII
jgi:hypothetical protein